MVKKCDLNRFSLLPTSGALCLAYGVTRVSTFLYRNTISGGQNRKGI